MAETRWVVSVDGQQQPGDHSDEETRALIRQYQGRHLLVWSPAVGQWTNPATLPQFQQAPQPQPQPQYQQAPQPQPQAQYQGPSFAAQQFSGDALKKQAGILSSLFDFGFKNFVTAKIIPILYIILMIVIALGVLGFGLVGGGGAILLGIRFGSFMSIVMGIVYLLLAPVLGVIYLALVRMWFEIAIVFFRIKDNLDTLVEQSKPKS